MIGGEAAIIARLLEGASQAEAQADIRARMVGLLGPDDLVPGDTGDELLTTGLRNYAFASAGVYGLHADRKGVEAYISSLLEVVCGVVMASALARADESMAA